MQRPDLNVGQTLMSQRQTLRFAREKHNVSKIPERNITSQKFQRENSSVLN